MLTHLSLEGIALKTAAAFLQAIDFSQLEALSLDRCTGSLSLISSLTGVTQVLRNLKVRGSDVHSDDGHRIGTVQRFLCSFSGLETLLIGQGTCYDPVPYDWTAIKHHSPTLKVLRIDMRVGLCCPSPWKLGETVEAETEGEGLGRFEEACRALQKLEQLAVPVFCFRHGLHCKRSLLLSPLLGALGNLSSLVTLELILVTKCTVHDHYRIDLDGLWQLTKDDLNDVAKDMAHKIFSELHASCPKLNVLVVAVKRMDACKAHRYGFLRKTIESDGSFVVVTESVEPQEVKHYEPRSDVLEC
ncbi:hypothetical protein LTR08_003515 [Meristemomyces frigidus]|nr:hypothetical protein LTR08_003515 [Meristemomyces frigidus]